MLSKWHIGIFILFVTVLTSFYNSDLRPKQEMLLHVSYSNTSNEDINLLADKLQDQLHEIGAMDVAILEITSGDIKISYQSNLDIDLIKSHISENVFLEKIKSLKSIDSRSGHNNSEEGQLAFDIYKVKTNPQKTDMGNNGLAVELKYDLGKPFSADITGILNTLIFSERVFLEKKQIVLQNIALASNIENHKIPEVRAGPSHARKNYLLQLR